MDNNAHQLTNKCGKLDQLRSIHQDVMGILQNVIDYAYPQLLLEFTALYFLCLTKLFFAQESVLRSMYRQGAAMGITSFMIMLIVYAMCNQSQKLKDQVQ